MKTLAKGYIVLFGVLLTIGWGRSLAAAPSDRIVDVHSSYFSRQCPGEDYWFPEEYGGIDYWYTFAVDNDECSAGWEPQMEIEGRYQVSAVFWARTPESGWRSDNVKYIIRENGVPYEIRIDQTGGEWERKRVYLGEFLPQADFDLSVEVWDNDGRPLGDRLVVADTIEFIYREPVPPSTTFSPGETVRVNAEGLGLNCRTGPGLHHGVIRGIPEVTSGEVQSADDNGLFTDGYYWWRVAWEDGNGTTGWSVEEGMELVSTPPPSPSATPAPTPSVVTTPALTATPVPPTPAPTVELPPTATPPEPVPTATIFITPPPTVPPTPCPQETLTLGLVTVYADSIHGGTGWPKVASGNVNINGVIYAAGEIEINREGGVDGIYTISGATRLYLKEIPLPWNPEPGEVTLYDGEFS
ncbi:MAG: hypothetical protein P9M08_07545, partial [Candidatus Erginobacter occultus]|nr:hypothetical protein [Candidatus Erginobacter occultus]